MIYASRADLTETELISLHAVRSSGADDEVEINLNKNKIDVNIHCQKLPSIFALRSLLGPRFLA